MDIEPITGRPLRFPPGRVAVRLDEQHKRAYQRLYARYRTNTDALPVLRERDFDGRTLKLTPAQVEALNRGFASLSEGHAAGAGVFDAQAQARSRLFKKLQYLS
jgi:hypothetical protein